MYISSIILTFKIIILVTFFVNLISHLLHIPRFLQRFNLQYYLDYIRQYICVKCLSFQLSLFISLFYFDLISALTIAAFTCILSIIVERNTQDFI